MGLIKSVITLYKDSGETPLECIERFKKDNSEYMNEKMTYAGRLDPLAEGILLVLVGEECKNKEKYLRMDKEYEVDILLGFATDTYDILGLVKSKFESRKGGLVLRSEGGKGESSSFADTEYIQNILKSFVGKFFQKYPAYSSKYFNKARSGELNDDEIEEKEVEIKSLKFLGTRQISKNELEKYIKESIALVKGDFRQEEILNKWQEVMARLNLANFPVVSIRVNCTSGTYMRSLANSIGEKVAIPALALNIKRTRIGKYNISQARPS